MCSPALILEGKNLNGNERTRLFTNQIVKLAQEDGIELKPADVARRAADHLAGQDRPGIHWRTMDDHRRDLEADETDTICPSELSSKGIH